MSNSIYLAGRDLDFIKALLAHMTPVSKSLATLILDNMNTYEAKVKRDNQIMDSYHDDCTYQDVI